ncbi:MAG: GyrI-like domain-containing protein [Deltaproteobacteria bacterium]|nr:GyrI-like domain-containing protein [Deltaproteobacteria bacterium]
MTTRKTGGAQRATKGKAARSGSTATAARAAKRDAKKTAPKRTATPARRTGDAKPGKTTARGPLDLVRLHAACFSATRTPAVVRLPALNCLALEGRGAPESQEFQDAVGAIFGVAYTLKFSQKATGRDFKVPPLEALWWSDYDLSRLADPRELWRVPRHTWRWKALLLIPDFVTSEDVRAARQVLSDRRGGDPLPGRVHLDRIDEGACMQVLHVGPYAEEPRTIARMQASMKEQGLTPCGFHHEIYLGDPRRTASARLRTILRQPVR